MQKMFPCYEVFTMSSSILCLDACLHMSTPNPWKRFHLLQVLLIGNDALVTITGITIPVPYLLSRSHCNSFEDWAPVDFIYGCPIFKWVAETSLPGSLFISIVVAEAMAARWQGPIVRGCISYLFFLFRLTICRHDFRWVFKITFQLFFHETTS